MIIMLGADVGVMGASLNSHLRVLNELLVKEKIALLGRFLPSSYGCIYV